MMTGNNMFVGFDNMWAYVKGLEDRVRSLEGTVEALTEELRKAKEGQRQQDGGAS